MRSQLSQPESPPEMTMGAAWSHVAMFASAMEASLDKWLMDAYRIGLTEFRALGVLTQAPDGELRVNDLAQLVGLNPSSATRLVSRLESKGLVCRDVCEADGRGVYAVLDGRGDELLRTIGPAYEERVCALLDESGINLRHLDAFTSASASRVSRRP